MAPREPEETQRPPDEGGAAAPAGERAEAELRRERHLLRSLTETSPVGITVVDRDGHITFANRRAERILGLTKSEITGRSYDSPAWRISRYDGSAFPESELPFRRVMETRSSVRDVRHAIEWPGGRRVLLSVNASPLFDAAGRFDGMVATLEDVTEREAAEEARRSSEEKFRTLFGAADDALFLMDGRVFTDVNAKCVEMFGLSSESDIVGHTPMDYSPPLQPDGRDSSEKALQCIGAALGGEPQRFYWKYCRKDRVPFDAEVLLNAFTSGGKVYLQAAVRDISERIAAEKALRESEERYRDFFENASDVVFTVDIEGNLLTLNKAGEAASGYSRAEAVGLNFFSLVAAESAERAREMMRRKLAGEVDRTTYEVNLNRKDGGTITLDVSTRLVFQNGVPVGVQGIARDVTQRRRLEAELQQAQKMEGIGRLAGGIAHDFNNLLTAILGQAELARLLLDEGDQPRRELDQIVESARRAASLTRQLLAFARKELIRPQVISLNELVLEVDKLLRRLIGEHIALLTIPAPGLGSVRVDPGQLEQVLVNLAVNARDAMPNGGRLTIETANITLDEEYARRHAEVMAGPHVMLAVSDTGVGMTKDVLEHAFEPFYTTKGPGEGTGLGLATCYGIVRQNGGHIAAYSEPGRGTTFRIYLPRVTAEQHGRIAPERGAPQALVGGTETVLLAEDDALVRNLAANTLRKAGYTVLEATSGHDALAREREHPGGVDLLVTDLVMPRMGGRELADRLQAIRPGMKVLFTSGYTETGIAHGGVLDPGLAFLPKPFDPATLARKVRAVLDAESE